MIFGQHTPIRLHYSLILGTSECPEPDLAVKQFLEAAGFADQETSVEIIRGNYVVRYTLDGLETLTELRRVLNRMAKGLFSETTKAAVRNLKDRPANFAIEMYIRLPIFDIDDP